jgi:hypothetical protein
MASTTFPTVKGFGEGTTLAAAPQLTAERSSRVPVPTADPTVRAQAAMATEEGMVAAVEDAVAVVIEGFRKR